RRLRKRSEREKRKRQGQWLEMEGTSGGNQPLPGGCRERDRRRGEVKRGRKAAEEQGDMV
ncbi:hypothetical protein AMTR_s00141p00076470, partial [Amborella trichopoda]